MVTVALPFLYTHQVSSFELPEKLPFGEVSANVGYFSQYVWRGEQQNAGQSAIQGGFDYIDTQAIRTDRIYRTILCTIIKNYKQSCPIYKSFRCLPRCYRSRFFRIKDKNSIDKICLLYTSDAADE